MRACAFFPPRLDPVLDGRKGHKDTGVAPQVPARWAGGQTVLDHEPHRQIDHAVGGLTTRWRQIRQVRLEVLLTLRTVMLRIGDHEIPWTPEVEMAQVVQRPLKLLGPIGCVTTAWTWLPLVIATRGDEFWRWQVGNRGHPFGGIGSIRTRTEHGCALLARMLGPALYDKCSTGAIPKPGKDAIVSYNAPFTTCVRGLCHGIPSRFLPTRADRPGVGVPDALWAVAIGACCRSPHATQAADAPVQVLQKAQAFSGSHPSTLLHRLCAGDRDSQAAALS